MTGDQVVLLSIALAILGVVIGLAVLLAFIAGGAVVAFTVFMLGLWETTPILPILLFVLFPPTLIVFLVGLVMMRFFASRAATKPIGEANEDPAAREPWENAKVDEATRRAAVESRRKLGYEE